MIYNQYKKKEIQFVNMVLFVIIFILFSNKIFAQTIYSVNPLNSTINQNVVFTVSGYNLTNDMVFHVQNMGYAIDIGGTSTERYFEGTFDQWGGVKEGVIKDEQGGNILFIFSVEVNYLQW